MIDTIIKFAKSRGNGMVALDDPETAAALADAINAAEDAEKPRRRRSKPEPTPEPEPDSKPEPTPEPEPDSKPEPEPTPEPEG
jgi:protein TonB